MFDLYYKKNDNNALFESFRNVGITNVQTVAIPASKVYKEYSDFQTDLNIKSFEDITKIYQETLKNCAYKDSNWTK